MKIRFLLRAQGFIDVLCPRMYVKAAS
jgi:hypothetical protein